MSEEFIDVVFRQDHEALTIRGKTQDYERGDVVAVPKDYAKNTLLGLDIVERISGEEGEPYEVLSEDIQETIGKKGERDPELPDPTEGQEEGEEQEQETQQTSEEDTGGEDVNLGELDYNELQDLAKEHGIAANQSTEDLIEALEDELS